MTHLPHSRTVPLDFVSEGRRRWMWMFACMLAFMVLGFAFEARAQIFSVVGLGCGGLLIGGVCPSNIEDGIFTYFVCNMETLIGEVFGQFYCQLNLQFRTPMTAALTLAVALFGVSFTIGLTQATAKEFMVFLLKIALIWGFATQAELLIGVAYSFFMGGLKEGIAIVVGAIIPVGGYTPGTGTGGGEIYRYMDDIFNNFVTLTTESAGADPDAAATATGDAEFCKNALFAALVLLAIAFPPLFIVGVMVLLKFVMFFLRAAFGYIYAIIGISFLIVLAPIFLTFAFWRPTRQYFDKWLGHLAAMALQMVIIFAFIAFVLSMDVSSVAKDLMNLVVPNKTAVESPGIKWPWQLCTICEFTVTKSTGTGTSVPIDTAKCNEDPGKPIDPAALMGPSHSGTRDTLLKLASKTLLTLLVLSYVVSALLDTVPVMARMIASAGNVTSPALAAKQDPVTGAQNLLPAEKAFDSFQKAFEDRLSKGGNPVTAYSEAFTDASKALMVGTRDGGKGLTQQLTDWLGNPI